MSCYNFGGDGIKAGRDLKAGSMNRIMAGMYRNGAGMYRFQVPAYASVEGRNRFRQA